jgi:hypothetical protein
VAQVSGQGAGRQVLPSSGTTGGSNGSHRGNNSVAQQRAALRLDGIREQYEWRVQPERSASVSAASRLG